MAYTVTTLSTNYSSNAASPINYTVTPNAIGDYILVCVTGLGYGPFSVAAPFTLLTAASNNSGSSANAYWFGWQVTTLTPQTLSISDSGGSDFGTVVLEVSVGVSTTWHIDGSNGTYNSTGPTSYTFPTLTPTGAGRIWFGNGDLNGNAWTLSSGVTGSVNYQAWANGLGSPIYDILWWYVLPSASAFAPTVTGNASYPVYALGEVLLYTPPLSQIVMMI